MSVFIGCCGGQDTLPAPSGDSSAAVVGPAAGQDIAASPPGKSVDCPVATDAEREAATVLANHLDLERPGMETFRAAVARGDHRGLLALFRERLVKRLRATPPSRCQPVIEPC